jgi:hypothetical protein
VTVYQLFIATKKGYCSGRKEALNKTVTDFDIPVEPVRSMGCV